jgi:hypothetical protein
MRIDELTFEAKCFLDRLYGSTQSPEEKELLLAAHDALDFIRSTGQVYDFEDYRKGLDSNTPDRAVAAFTTREEANAWLKDNPKPPTMAYVLIADEYHIVMYFREFNQRALLSHPAIEYHLEEMMRDGLPPAVATFNTREEAKAWFYRLPERPSQAVIQMGGEHYLLAYHRNIDHLAFHPFSIVERLKERRKKMEEKEKGTKEPGS